MASQSETFFHNGAQALVDDLSHAQYRIVEDQDHAIAPEAPAPALGAFFTG